MEAKARAAAEKAIALDNALAEPHAVLGVVNAAESMTGWAPMRSLREPSSAILTMPLHTIGGRYVDGPRTGGQKLTKSSRARCASIRSTPPSWLRSRAR